MLSAEQTPTAFWGNLSDSHAQLISSWFPTDPSLKTKFSSRIRPPNQSCEIEVPVVEEKPVADAERKRDVKDPLDFDPKKVDSLTGQADPKIPA